MGQNAVTKKSGIRVALNWLVAAALVIFFSCLGAVCREWVRNPEIGFLVSLAVLLLLFLGSVGGFFVLKARLNKRNVRDTHEKAEVRRIRMADNAQREANRLRLAYFVATVYLAALVLSALSLCYFSGAGGYGTAGSMVLGLYVMYGVVSRLFQNTKPGGHDDALSEEQYPQLYRIAREAAGNKEIPIYIFLAPPTIEAECNASVAREGEAVHLFLGPVLLCVLNEKELLCVLRHEFAHIDCTHLKERRRYIKWMDFLAGERATNTIFDSVASWIMRLPASYIYIEGEYYFMLSSRQNEAEADVAAVSEEDGFHYVSALAKTGAHRLFVFEQEPYTNLYRSETIPEHFTTDRIKAYRSALAEREAEWREILEREIPARVASHPTFRQRWEEVNCCEYSMKPASEEGELEKECWAAAAESDQKMAQISQEKYDQLRQEGYLDLLKTVKDHEAAERPLVPEEIRPVILAYYGIGMPERAEALCDRIIEEINSPFATAFAKYWKGVLLLHQYDKSGIRCIYDAMEANPNYIEEGINLIGSYCTMMGLQEELEEYRSRALDFWQTTQDRVGVGISAKAKLTKETLPDDWQERILTFILDVGGADILQVYLVREQISEEYAPSAFVLRYAETASEKRRASIQEKVFHLLDDWPDEWEFSLYAYEAAMEKPLSRVPGACLFDEQRNATEKER